MVAFRMAPTAMTIVTVIAIIMIHSTTLPPRERFGSVNAARARERTPLSRVARTWSWVWSMAVPLWGWCGGEPVVRALHRSGDLGDGGKTEEQQEAQDHDHGGHGQAFGGGLRGGVGLRQGVGAQR